MRDKTDKIISWMALSVLILQIMLFILSWIVTATNPDLKVRSLLSGEGVRWFIGAYVDNQSNFVLVWLLLLSISFGAVRQSGLLSAVRNIRRLGFRERLAIRFVSIELVLFIIVLFLLTCVPHAVLLNVAGNIYPGSLSMGFVALLSFVLCTFAITYYNVVANRISLSGIFGLLTAGVSSASSVFCAVSPCLVSLSLHLFCVLSMTVCKDSYYHNSNLAYSASGMLSVIFFVLSCSEWI